MERESLTATEHAGGQASRILQAAAAAAAIYQNCDSYIVFV